MKDLKLQRNIWIISGITFILYSILMLTSKQPVRTPIIYVVVSILFFVNAYLIHSKIDKNNK